MTRLGCAAGAFDEEKRDLLPQAGARARWQSVAAAQSLPADSAEERGVPLLPRVLAHARAAAPLLPVRMATALAAAGVHTLSELEGRGFEFLLLEGVGTKTVEATLECLQELAALPVDRLERLCRHDVGPAVIPNLPPEVLASLCYATSVDDEIRALVADLPDRNQDLVLARWGSGGQGPRTLDDVGAQFGITRERARQITTLKEQQIRESGLCLRLAFVAVKDLDEVGGALPDADYAVLLRHGSAPISPQAMGILCTLHELGVVPEITFDEESKLWMTAAGKARLAEKGGSHPLAAEARRRARPHLRQIGAVPLELVDSISPFGRAHALSLITRRGSEFRIVDGFAVQVPPSESALVRQCRKTLAVTGRLGVEELTRALRRSKFRVTGELLAAVLEHSADFEVSGGDVELASSVFRDGLLAPAEAAGFGILDRAGGAMVWWDFVEAMERAGFSAPMAAVVLGKPAVHRIGSAIYAIRGRDLDRRVSARLQARRRTLIGRGMIRNVSTTGEGEVAVEYVLNRFAMQGVMSAPRELKGLAREWIASGAGLTPFKLIVSKGFMWPLGGMIASGGLQPGDEVRAVFRPGDRHVRFECIRYGGIPETPAAVSQEERVLRALFGKHI